MAQVCFSGVSFSYPGFSAPAVAGVDLLIEDGEFLSLLGPSGAGKSTLLRLLTGLEKPSSGEILLAGDMVTQLPPGDRDIASVTSNPSMFAHLTVEQNLAFPMSLSGEAPSVIKARVADVAGAMGLQRLLHRFPRELNQSERHAVYLARAMARPVAALALDEPLAHLDHEERRLARRELATLQRRTNTTTIYVTQDYTEAMTLSDRIAVMINGQVIQVAEPLDVYHKPASLAVAQFFGAPPMNTLTGVLTDDGARIGDLLVPVPTHIDATIGSPVVVGVRAEEVHLLPRGAALEVTSVDSIGNDAYVRGFLAQDSARQPLVLRCAARSAPRRGAGVYIDVLDDEHVLFFDPVTGRRL